MTRCCWYIIPTLFLLLHIQPLASQIWINEYMASNSTIIQDPSSGDYSDWIELYNSGPAAVNLKGYYLTDNLNTPLKWQITGDLTIESKGFVLIWVDGLNTPTHPNYKLSADGEQIGFFSPSQVLIDSISFLVQKTDISAGRSLDGSAVWGFFRQPTPGASNANSVFFSDFTKNAPEFSLRGGIYDSPQTLELSSPLGGTIRYALGGIEPGDLSPEYNEPIPITGNLIVRARIFTDGTIPGPVITHSYFLEGDLKSRKLPVISISSNPDNFWDADLGIYVQNYKPLWEIPANIEMFENNGSDRAAFNEPVGIKINGLYSWQLPQKMLGVYFRGQYGSSNLDYPLLFHKGRSSYKNFALRASGSDWSYILFRDVLGHDAARLNTDLDFMDFRPSIVFFNGQYMGIHNIREKVDADFIEKNHSIEPGTFDLVENENYPEAGDLANYTVLEGLLSKDLSDDSNFAAVSELIDIENLTDLVIVEMATGNTSIDHNVMAWKPKESGKWKWVIMDLDRGFFNPGNNLISFYVGQNSLPFKKLMNNESYRTYFAKRLTDQLYTSFHPRRMKTLINAHASEIEGEIPFHVNRWLGTTSSYGNAIPSVGYWNSKVCDVRAYVEERPMVLLTDLSLYGFTEIANLGISVVPANAGSLKINDLTVPESNWTGPYLKNQETHITAVDKSGFRFLGWKSPEKKILIAKGAEWKYLDNGSNAGTAWNKPEFDDSSWKSGQAEFGYGDGDETTIIDYGGSSSNRYITTYFRHTFSLSPESSSFSGFVISLLKDDGAVIYLNGTEVLRCNLPCGAIGSNTLAITSISDPVESYYNSWFIDADLLRSGENVIAAEIHQNSKSSSDVSFDLELAGFDLANTSYLSTGNELALTVTTDTFLSAVYEPTGQCIVPGIISGDFTLSKACSPWLVQGDVSIDYGASLTLEPGVEIWMSPKSNILVRGTIEAIGTAEERIIIKSDPKYSPQSWGAITFLNTSGTSELRYVTIENASEGALPIRDYAALSAFNGDLLLDNLILEENESNPIVSRYSDVVLTNSTLRSKVTGDLINVKYGTARIENCVFKGNAMPDNDAIDYDGITDGIIHNCLIYDFLGFNSDGLDIGEKTTNLKVDSLIIYNITDKGISVGQNSSVTIKNALLVNCNLGMGLKDLSRVVIDHCSFYGTGIPVSCYEKNPGSAGGIASLTNSILSNSSVASFYADSKSSLHIEYSISDNTPLPSAPGNLFGNPLFLNPGVFDFSLAAGSPASLSGQDGATPANMGSSILSIDSEPYPIISRIFTNPFKTSIPEFICIYNPSPKTRDLANYSVSKGFTYTFPPETSLAGYETLYLTSDAGAKAWWDFPFQVLQWDEGQLSDGGEAIELMENHGLVIDYLKYEYPGNWPSAGFLEGMMMVLSNPKADNHFGENWLAESLETLFIPGTSSDGAEMSVYPNPTFSKVELKIPKNEASDILVYSSQGKLLGKYSNDGTGFAEIDLGIYHQGIVLIKVGKHMKKVVLLK